VKAAQSAYSTGRVPFFSLIQAERDLIGLRDRFYEVQADYHRRLARLDRAVGG
jgi:outer membrane protein TolC